MLDEDNDSLDWPVIFSYTRTDALHDGVLVDGQREPYREVSRQHVGSFPIDLSAALHALIEQAVAHPRWLNDYAGVWHDILTMAGARSLRPGDRRSFQVIITGTGRQRYHDLVAICDYESLTLMLPGDE